MILLRPLLFLALVIIHSLDILSPSAGANGTDTPSAVVQPSIDDLRESVIEYLLGSPQFDDTSGFDNLGDKLFETTQVGHCRGVKEIRWAALSAFSYADFKEISTTRKTSQRFPEYSIHLIREWDAKKANRDVALFYFLMEKSGIACKYTLGVIGQRQILPSRHAVRGLEHDMFFREVKNMVLKISDDLGHP